MARPKKVIEIEKREGSWTKLEIVIFAVVVALVGFIIWALAYRTDATALIEVAENRQEVCPEGDGWVKVDDLDGLTYTYDVAEGFEVTDNCYKHATYVHYGTGDTVTVDEHCGWEWTGRGLKWVCKEHELSHASFYLVPVSTPTPEPTLTAEPTPTSTPEPTPTIVFPTAGQQPTVTPTVEPTQGVTPSLAPTEGPPFTPTATPTEVLGFGSANPDVLPETGTGGFGSVLLAGFAVLSGLLGRVLLKK